LNNFGFAECDLPRFLRQLRTCRDHVASAQIKRAHGLDLSVKPNLLQSDERNK